MVIVGPIVVLVNVGLVMVVIVGLMVVAVGLTVVNPGGIDTVIVGLMVVAVGLTVVNPGGIVTVTVGLMVVAVVFAVVVVAGGCVVVVTGGCVVVTGFAVFVVAGGVVVFDWVFGGAVVVPEVAVSVTVPVCSDISSFSGLAVRPQPDIKKMAKTRVNTRKTTITELTLFFMASSPLNKIKTCKPPQKIHIYPHISIGHRSLSGSLSLCLIY